MGTRILTNKQIAAKAQAIIDRDDKDIQLHFAGYVEPGHTNPKRGIIATGNWHDYREAGKAFEAMGIELEWNDEWTECSECNGLVRIKPGSFDWIPAFTDNADGDGIACHAVWIAAVFVVIVTAQC